MFNIPVRPLSKNTTLTIINISFIKKRATCDGTRDKVHSAILYRLKSFNKLSLIKWEKIIVLN